MNHNCLVSMEVTHPSLEIIKTLCSSYHLGNKLTGAGGGGCSITVLPSVETTSKDINLQQNIDQLINTLVNVYKYEVLVSRIGGIGVVNHLQVSISKK